MRLNKRMRGIPKNQKAVIGAVGMGTRSGEKGGDVWYSSSRDGE